MQNTIESIYINYPIKYSSIYQELEKYGYKTITFYIDLQNIARGLYNKKTIDREISQYYDNKELKTLPRELFNYIQNLYNKFKKYDPFFVIFYDKGISDYHKAINKEYKSTRKLSFDDTQLTELFQKLKDYYFELIYTILNTYDNVSVVYLKNLESDFVPQYVITNNLLDAQDKTNMNVIFSTDKDLLQTTKFENTYQYTVTFNNRYIFNLWNKYNGIKYIYPKFKPGIINTEYIPLILSISGDNSDNIKGIKGVGYKKAIDIIIKYELKPDLSNIDILKERFKNEDVELIKQNYKLISFDRLISTLGYNIKREIDKLF